MDWQSMFIGAIIGWVFGVFSTIFAYEYKHWRDQKNKGWRKKERNNKFSSNNVK